MLFQKNGITAIFITIIAVIAIFNIYDKQHQFDFQNTQTKLQLLLDHYEEEAMSETQDWDSSTATTPASQPSMKLASIGTIARPSMSNDEETEKVEKMPTSHHGLIASSPALTTMTQVIETQSEEDVDSEDSEEPAPKKRKLIEEYTVQKSDTISTIAAMHGITTATLLQSNGLRETSKIQPGDTLNIPAASGVIVTVKKGDTLSELVKTYKANAQKTRALNNIENDTIKIGNKVLLVNGTAPPPPKPAPTKTKSAPSNNTSIVSTAHAKEVSYTGNAYHKPVAYGYSYGRVHSNNGIDVARNSGASIYSFKGGKVIQAASGWNGGYGNCVKVQHSDGTVTLYGHMSSIYVSYGQTVDKGQVLGTVGNTGRSTGPHLHFEVRGGRNPYAGYAGNL